MTDRKRGRIYSSESPHQVDASKTLLARLRGSEAYFAVHVRGGMEVRPEGIPVGRFVKSSPKLQSLIGNRPNDIIVMSK